MSELLSDVVLYQPSHLYNPGDGTLHSQQCENLRSKIPKNVLFLSLLQIHEFNDICWEKCMDKPGSKIDSRTETCLNHCVDRFIDVSLLITNRFAQLLQKSAM
jgi:hypothetical protein